MRILIHGLNFAPELVGVGKFSGEMAEWLAETGHDVRVVTAPPFNPASRVAPGFSSWLYRRENRVYGGGGAPDRGRSNGSRQMGRLSIFRCPLWIPRKTSGAKRALHLASFALSSFWSMLRQIPWQPQVVIVIEPTMFCVPNGWLTARLSGAKSWLHVQDFEVDAAFELGLFNSPSLRRLACVWEEKCMRSFDRVSTISEKMRALLSQKGVDSPRSVIFPNWVDTSIIFPQRSPSPLRAELGIPPEAVVALYSGTMAQKQGLEVLAEAASRMASRSDLQFVICGEGSAKSSFSNLTSQMKNVRLLPLQPLDRLNDLLNLADIHLLPQRANAADLMMPSKLTGMLASGRPVVATACPGTQLAEVVEGRGIVVPPEDVPALVSAIEQLTLDPGLREQLGRSARAYAVSNLEKDLVLQQFEKNLLNSMQVVPE